MTLKPLRNLWAREARANFAARPICDCPEVSKGWFASRRLRLHQEVQDRQAPAWQSLNQLIDAAIADGREVFSPAAEMNPEEWAQIVELPARIGELKQVKHLVLYGSSLVRIPPEIGGMQALEEFTPYTSYRLHWLPWEITRCERLVESTISTRALYGVPRSRLILPRLPQAHPGVPKRCSVCDTEFGGLQPLQKWVVQVVATDRVPLLAHACSPACIRCLP